MKIVKIELTFNVDEYFEEVLSNITSNSISTEYRREYAVDDGIQNAIMNAIQKDLQRLVDDAGAIYDYGNYFQELCDDLASK